MSKKFSLILISILLLVVGAGSIFATSLIKKNSPKEKLHPQTEPPRSAQINYPAEYNYRQGYNECGPYNVAAVIRALKQENISGDKVAQEMKLRLGNGYSLPPGLEDYLSKQDLQVESYFLSDYSTLEKLNFLQDQLNQGKPIIILGENSQVQHYLTLFGYSFQADSQELVFHIYDPLHSKGESGYTIDSNGDNPGNRDFTQAELVDFWSKGGMFGFYQWYALVVTKLR